MSKQTADVRQRVLNHIEETQGQLAAYLGEYIRFKSVNPAMAADDPAGQLRECQDWLISTLSTWGAFDEVRSLAADREQPNVVARRRGRGDGPSLLFNGHSDVVPVTAGQAAAWTIGTPWGGQLIEGKVCGRGASDMKGGIAAFLWAVKALGDVGIVLRGDILVTIVSGEETGNHAVGIDLLAPVGYTGDFGILAEPTDLQVCPATVGEFYFLIRVEGRSASLASRHLCVHPAGYGVAVPGANAIDKMWKIQRALADLEREWGVWQRHPFMAPGNMSINFSRLHGGETYSALADSCELTGSVLFNPSRRFADVFAEFRQAVDSVAQTDYWLREHPPHITAPYILDEKEPINLSPHDPGCEALIRAYRDVLGIEPTLACTTGTSDGNYLGARGQRIVTFGPGASAAGVHGPNEFVELPKLVQAAKIYAMMAIEWCDLSRSS